MSQQLLIDGSSPDQTQFALIGENGLDDFEYESKLKKNQKGNIYLGKVSRIEASLQAAFVDIGNDKNAFLAFGEIHPNYFQIPIADRDSLIAAEAEIEEIHNNETEENKSTEEVNGNIVNENEEEVNGNIAEEEDEIIEGNTKKSTEKNKPIDSNRLKSKSKSQLKRRLYRSYKIQEVIKTGQLILVQVVKEERGNKGAALTSYISLAGKYSVLMPNSTKTKGISRKISTSDDRNKIKKIIDELKVPTDMGLIIRTAGLNKTKNEIKKDYNSLHKLWVNIVKETEKAIAPALIHEEGNLLRRVIRDVYNKDMKTIHVEGSDAFKETKKYMSQIIPSYSKFVKEYKNKVPIFSKYGVEKEILRMFEPEVKLKSGGYLVINPTEALVAIDVNSGGATKERNIEKTALKTNIEAAQEISKQIKIRDLSGLIIIDFIDMLSFNNRKQVERRLKEKCRSDRARIQIGRISNFGLLEMSRQRLRESAVKWEVKLTDESFAQKLLKMVELKAVLNKAKFVDLKVCKKISDFLKENFIEDLKYFEKKNKIKIDIITDDKLIIPEYIINLKNKSKKTLELVEHFEKLKNLDLQKKESNVIELKDKKKYKKKIFRKKKFFKKVK